MATGVAAKTKKISDGLKSPERGPKEGAKAEEDRYYSELQKVIDNKLWDPDKWLVSDSEILAAAQKAVPTIATAIRRKAAKIAKKGEAALTDTYDVSDEVDAMSTASREERIAKSTVYQTRRGEEADKRKGIGVGGA